MPPPGIAAPREMPTRFSPKAPAGKEGNWVQTMPGRGYNVVLRLYGPLEPWFNKTWKPGDFEPRKERGVGAGIRVCGSDCVIGRVAQRLAS